MVTIFLKCHFLTYSSQHFRQGIERTTHSPVELWIMRENENMAKDFSLTFSYLASPRIHLSIYHNPKLSKHIVRNRSQCRLAEPTDLYQSGFKCISSSFGKFQNSKGARHMPWCIMGSLDFSSVFCVSSQLFSLLVWFAVIQSITFKKRSINLQVVNKSICHVGIFLLHFIDATRWVYSRTLKLHNAGKEFIEPKYHAPHISSTFPVISFNWCAMQNCINILGWRGSKNFIAFSNCAALSVTRPLNLTSHSLS